MLLHLPNSRPIGRFHLSFLAAIQSPGAEVFTVADLTLPDPSSPLCHISNRPIAAPGAFYAGRVVSGGWGRSPTSISERASGLQAREVSIGIRDESGDWRALRARYANRLRRSPVRIRVGVRGLDQANWHTDFFGILDSWEKTGPATWTLTCRTDDRPLEAKFPTHPFLLSDWPNAQPEILGKYAPIVGGIHRSNGVQSGSGTGMVLTYHVDTKDYRHAVSLGRLKAVVPVYGNGQVIPASDYTVTYPVTASGYVWTVIKFSTSAHEAKTITCDVQGLTDRGDGTGSVVTNPVKLLRLLLVNWLYGDWKSGDWLDGSAAPIDERLWWDVARYCERKGHEGSFYVGGDQTTGLAAIEAWAATFELKPAWTNEGRIGLHVLDHSLAEWASALWARGRVDLKAFRLAANARQTVDEIDLQYLPGAADGRTFETLTLQDLDVGETSTLSRPMTWSAAYRNAA